MSALLRKRRVLAAKIETTPGTAESLTGSDGVFNVYDVSANPTAEMIQRMGQGVFSPLPGVLGAFGGVATFSLHLIGGDPLPAWATTFLPACGYVADGDVYSPVSEAPGTNVKTLTIGSYQDGVLKKLRGCAGNVVFTFISGQIVVATFTFTGIWDAPTDVALLTPNYPNVLPPRFADAAMLIGGSGGWSPKLEQMTIDLGNVVTLREDPSDISGYSNAIITDRLTTGTMNPESDLVANQDTYGQWRSSAEQSLEFSFGDAGNRLAFAAPKMQFTDPPQEGDRGGLQIDEITFQLNRDADAGDDEMTITID